MEDKNGKMRRRDVFIKYIDDYIDETRKNIVYIVRCSIPALIKALRLLNELTTPWNDLGARKLGRGHNFLLNTDIQNRCIPYIDCDTAILYFRDRQNISILPQISCYTISSIISFFL